MSYFRVVVFFAAVAMYIERNSLCKYIIFILHRHNLHFFSHLFIKSEQPLQYLLLPLNHNTTSTANQQQSQLQKWSPSNLSSPSSPSPPPNPSIPLQATLSNHAATAGSKVTSAEKPTAANTGPTRSSTKSTSQAATRRTPRRRSKTPRKKPAPSLGGSGGIWEEGTLMLG
jgi:hypothetical protein